MRRLAALAAGIALLALPPLLPPAIQAILFPVGITVLLALGLNVVVGLAGLLDLGYVAFYAVGAYTTALLGTKAGWSTWETLPVAIAAAMVAGVLLGAPTLRLRGDYLAIVTLGFGEIVRIIANNVAVTNGPRGVFSIPHPPPGPPGIGLGPVHLQFSLAPLPYIYLVILACLGAVALLAALQRSRVGRAWMAIREDEDAAEVMGVPTYAMKLWAFAIGASTGGLAGALYASKAGYISPVNFELLVSILVLAAVVLGGMGSTPGVVLGAFALAFLPEYFRELERYRVLVFGAALVVLMVVRPQGLVPSRRRAGRGADFIEPSSPGREVGQADLELREALAGPLGTGPLGAGPLGTGPLDTSPDDRRPLLRLERLGVSFGGVRALQGLDLEVGEGEIVSLIGPNGAGKTTVFNCVTGMARPSGGRVLLDGRPLVARRPHRITRHGVARTFQNIRLFANMTVLENVLVGSDARHRTSVPGALVRSRRHRREETDARALALALLDFVGIATRSSDVASNLSYGDQRRLEIARALATRPRLLLLDEPAAGMNPAEKRALVGLIRRIQRLGLTLLLIEHDMGLVMDISDRIVVLNFGSKIADGSPAAVRGDPAVVAAYLGDPDAA